MGPTVGFKLDSEKFINEVADSSVAYYQQGEVITYEIYRDSDGNNSGGLVSQPVTVGTWNDCPSASTIITKFDLIKTSP